MNFVFESAPMHALVARVKLLATSEANVVISGESGVGKKALARLIHAWSLPEEAPFACIPCSSLECDVREVERGLSHSGLPGPTTLLPEAIASTPGGVLLLDEIANLSDRAQHSLLEYLLDRELRPRRGNEVHRRPARIICTTQADVGELARARLRDDLFHRLYELHLSIPPLRDRSDDLPALADHFLSQLRQQHRLSVTALDSAALSRLQEHDWPGNVRELRNTLYRACFDSTREVLGVQEIETSLLPAAVEAPQQYDQLKLADVERRIILRRLDRFHGNKAKAAIDLGVTDRTLRNKMRLYRESGQLEQ